MMSLTIYVALLVLFTAASVFVGIRALQEARRDEVEWWYQVAMGGTAFGYFLACVFWIYALISEAVKYA